MACRRTVAALIASGICLFPDPALAQAPADASLSSTRLVFSPTSRVLARGEITVNIFMVMPSIQVGVTSRLTVGGFLIPFRSGPLFLASGKYQLHRTEQRSVAGGIMHFGLPGGHRLGMAVVNSTRERANGAWTFGGGTAWRNDSSPGVARSPFVQFGTERWLDRNTLFVTEAYVGPDFAIFAGAKRIKRESSTTDYVLMFVVTERGPAIMPALVLSVGSRRR